MSNKSTLSIISKSDDFKSCLALFVKFKSQPVCARYLIAKKIFESPQRKFDMHWSVDTLINGVGDFCGVRINSRFFRLSKVKRQLAASKTK